MPHDDQDETRESMDLGELFARAKRERQQRLDNGIETDQYRLVYNPKTIAIEIYLKENPRNINYEIDPESITTAKDYLLWILQVHGREWHGDRGVTDAFIQLFDDVLGTFTFHGRSTVSGETLAEGLILDWATRTAVRIDPDQPEDLPD